MAIFFIELAVFGYFDPNTGGLLFQVLATSFAMLSGIALLFSRQIRAVFGRVRRFLHDRLSHGDADVQEAQIAPESPDLQEKTS
ncbi:MAG: hypothetical protein JXA33_15920 [Anaerolineae bacterium]|nr:hypothetical protein [Anaerolineae bacterium]